MRYKITYTDKSGNYCEQETTGASKAFDLQTELKSAGNSNVEMHMLGAGE